MKQLKRAMGIAAFVLFAVAGSTSPQDTVRPFQEQPPQDQGSQDSPSQARGPEDQGPEENELSSARVGLSIN